MSQKQIREILFDLGYGDDPPAELMQTIGEFAKRKNVAGAALDVADVVHATMLFDIFLQKKERKA